MPRCERRLDRERPSNSALAAPMHTGVSRTDPIRSVPMRAVNETPVDARRLRESIGRLGEPPDEGALCSRSMAAASSQSRAGS